jgi:hypothetical protein
MRRVARYYKHTSSLILSRGEGGVPVPVPYNQREYPCRVPYRTLGKGATERAGVGGKGGNALLEAGNVLPYRRSKMELLSYSIIYPGQLMDKCTLCSVVKERRFYV